MLLTRALLSKGLILSRGATAGASTPEQAATTMLEALQLGYLVDPEALTTFTPQQHSEMLRGIAQLVGRDAVWKPMYPGFPAEVIAADEVRLWVNAYLYYVSFGEWLPDAKKEFEREHLQQSIRHPRVVRVEPLRIDLLAQLWAKPMALSPTEVAMAEDIAGAFGKEQIRQLYDATDFSHGENLAAATAIVGDLAAGLAKARNSEQVLRVVLSIYCEDPARGRDLQADKYRFPAQLRPLPRPARRAILSALAGCTSERDHRLLWKRRVLWRRVMRRVHPCDYADRPVELIAVIHASRGPATVNAAVEQALERHDVPAALGLLADNPGNLIRRVAHLTRLSLQHSRWLRLRTAIDHPHEDMVVAAIEEHGPKVRLVTLISALNALRNRDARVKVVRLPQDRVVVWRPDVPRIPDEVAERVIAALEGAIMVRLRSQQAPEGPVAVGAPEPVTLAHRYLSQTLDGLVPGQRIPLTGPIVRLFVHWKGDFDVDLGAIVANRELTKTMAYCDWTRLRPDAGLVHSGDIITAPDGAAEFIDAQTTMLTGNRGFHYLIASVVSFGGQPFASIDNYCGAMDRSSAMSGEIFEPATVATGMRSQVKGTSIVPFVVDMVAMELVWLDSSQGRLHGFYRAGNNSVVQLVRAELDALGTALTNGELLALWAKAHGATTVDRHNPRARELVAGLLSEATQR